MPGETWDAHVPLAERRDADVPQPDEHRGAAVPQPDQHRDTDVPQPGGRRGADVPAPPALADAMRRAIAAAERVRGTTSPNPPVGCVVLAADGQVVGVGATQPPPGPHAEVVALREAGERAAGGTAVVTLEPCAHHGRTPPCADALLAAGIAAVHYAVPDPHPIAAGGATALRTAGVAVQGGLLQAEVERGPLRAWLHFVRTGTPFVTWKFASTLDGRVAAADGTSRWISSPESRADVHAVRANVDAIVVGTGTALADDPALTGGRCASWSAGVRCRPRRDCTTAPRLPWRWPPTTRTWC